MVVFPFILCYWTPPQTNFKKFIQSWWSHGSCNLSIDWNHLISMNHEKASAASFGIVWTTICLIFFSVDEKKNQTSIHKEHQFFSGFTRARVLYSKCIGKTVASNDNSNLVDGKHVISRKWFILIVISMLFVKLSR